MRFLLDESVDARLAGFLRAKDHDVETVGSAYPHASKDEEVLAIAVAQNRVLITNDRDFGELVHRRNLQHRGVILLRLRTTRLASVETRLEDVLTRFSGNLAEMLVVTDHMVRVRGLASR